MKKNNKFPFIIKSQDITTSSQKFSSKPEKYSNPSISTQNTELSVSQVTSPKIDPATNAVIIDYSYSTREINSAIDMDTQLSNFKLLEPENIQKGTNDLPNVFYYTPKTNDEKEADVLDWDLGLTPEIKVLSSDDKSRIKASRLQEVDSYFTNMKNQITTCDEMVKRGLPL